MENKTKLFLAGGGIAGVLALIFGFLPQSFRGVNCGSLFVSSNDASVRDFRNTLSGMYGPLDHADNCVDARSGYLPFVIVLAVIAVALILVGIYLHDQAGKAEASATAVPRTPNPSAVGVYTQLSQLNAMRESGVLTEAEFSAAKKRLLGE